MKILLRALLALILAVLFEAVAGVTETMWVCHLIEAGAHLGLTRAMRTRSFGL